jgi:hypothetical protein
LPLIACRCEHEGVPEELLIAPKVLTVAPAPPTPVTSAIQQYAALHGRALPAGARIALPLLLLDTYGNDASDTSRVEIYLSGPDGSGEVVALSARALPMSERADARRRPHGARHGARHDAGSSPPRTGRASFGGVVAGAASRDSPRGSSKQTTSPRVSSKQTTSPRDGASCSGASPRQASAAVTCCAVSTASPGDPRSTGACVSSPGRNHSSSGGGGACGVRSAVPSAVPGAVPSATSEAHVDGQGHRLAQQGWAETEVSDVDDAWAQGASWPARRSHVIEHHLTIKGVFALSVSIGGQPLRGSPLELHVTAGLASGARSVLLPAPMPLLNHVPAVFQVQARDRMAPRHASAHHGALASPHRCKLATVGRMISPREVPPSPRAPTGLAPYRWS